MKTGRLTSPVLKWLFSLLLWSMVSLLVLWLCRRLDLSIEVGRTSACCAVARTATRRHLAHDQDVN